MNQIKKIWQGVSDQTKKFIGVRFMYVVIGLLVAHLIWVDKEEKTAAVIENKELIEENAILNFKLELLIEAHEKQKNKIDSLRGVHPDSMDVAGSIIYIEQFDIYADRQSVLLR